MKKINYDGKTSYKLKEIRKLFVEDDNQNISIVLPNSSLP